jgi:DNA polymerase-3 subunit chi
MAEALFYHLTESTLEEALPPLLEKSLERGWRAVVQVASPERRDALDQHLWTYRDDSFLAHGADLRRGKPQRRPHPLPRRRR